MRLLRDRDLGALRQQHPDGNLQSPPGRVHDTDRPIFALRSAKDLQGSTMQRMKGVEDPNMIRAQGIVGVGATIRTPMSSYRAAASRPNASTVFSSTVRKVGVQISALSGMALARAANPILIVSATASADADSKQKGHYHDDSRNSESVKVHCSYQRYRNRWPPCRRYYKTLECAAARDLGVSLSFAIKETP